MEIEEKVYGTAEHRLGNTAGLEENLTESLSTKQRYLRKFGRHDCATTGARTSTAGHVFAKTQSAGYGGGN